MSHLDPKALEAARNAIVDVWDDARGIDPNLHTMAEKAITSYLDALSSLPAQAVGVKALEWVKIAGRTKADGAPRWAATHPFGHYEIVLNTRDVEWWSPQFASKLWDSEAEAKSYVQAAHAQIIASMLAPSQPAAVGERADALWEQLLPLMQVEECPPGDPYKDKVAALALIEAALRSTP